MKIIKYFVLTLIVLFLAFLGITATLPKEYFVERSIEINAPQQIVFSQVVDFEAWQKWNPWNDMDANIEIIYGDRKKRDLKEKTNCL